MLPSLAFAALAIGACTGAGLDAASGAWTDVDGAAPAPAPPDRSGGVEAAQPAEPCEHHAAAAFTVALPEIDDTVGPVLARLLILDGRVPDGAIRPHEFVSYYLADAAPPEDAALRVDAALTEAGDGAFGLAAVLFAGAAAAELPRNLVLAIDTSDAMAGARIARVRQCCVAFAGSLRQGDVVAITALDPGAGTLLAPLAVAGAGDPVLVAHCNAIETTGAVDLSAGLDAAYSLADENRDGAGLNRVLLFTGGGLEPTVDDVAVAAGAAAGGPFEQVLLAGVGIGDLAAANPYDRAALDALTAAGAGPHLLVDSAAEAAAAFGERLPLLTSVALVAPAVTITLPPTLAIETLDGAALDALPGFAGADRLAPGQAAAVRSTARSCDAEFLDAGAVVRVAARAVDPSSGEFVEDTWEAPLADAAPGPSKRDAIVAYALALEAAQSLARDAALESAEAARAAVAAAAAASPDDPDLDEIGVLLDALLALL
jgi:hypothetical protein